MFFDCGKKGNGMPGALDEAFKSEDGSGGLVFRMRYIRFFSIML
jgi:hypothetical protein